MKNDEIDEIQAETALRETGEQGRLGGLGWHKQMGVFCRRTSLAVLW